jgi:nicotinamidase-related amidase
VLDRIAIARGFTPYQHTALLRELPAQVEEETAVIVVPEIDYYYRDDVQGADGQQMFVRALAAVARAAREQGIPVVCTQTAADGFSEPLEALATDTIEFTETAHGPRFVGQEFETLVYPLGNGWVQTTLAFWQEILAAREPLHVESHSSSEVSARGAH